MYCFFIPWVEFSNSTNRNFENKTGQVKFILLLTKQLCWNSELHANISSMRIQISNDSPAKISHNYTESPGFRVVTSLDCISCYSSCFRRLSLECVTQRLTTWTISIGSKPQPLSSAIVCKPGPFYSWAASLAWVEIFGFIECQLIGLARHVYCLLCDRLWNK